MTTKNIRPYGQTDVNRLNLLEAQAMIRQIAEVKSSIYPQYQGYWDGWVLVRVKKTIRTKMGVAFEKGDLTLMDPEIECDEFVTCYSIRNDINTLIERKYVTL